MKTAAKSSTWFEVHKQGLAELLEGKCKSLVILELIQNAWDEASTEVTVSLKPVPGQPLIEVVVTDNNPDGFLDLRDAFTLFAPSKKKADPKLRGRFNLGEKLVLSLCREASITSTTGAIKFGADGLRTKGKRRRESGSEFRGLMRITRSELYEAIDKIMTVIPPPGIVTHLVTEDGSTTLRRPDPVCVFEVPLPTEFADAEGVMRRTTRKTEVEVFEPTGDPGIYEMGIPVVDTGDRYTVNVQQKVPLSLSRDNVTPAFLRDVRTHVLNHTSHLLTEEEATETWVAQASSDEKCTAEAINNVLDKQYGEKRVAFDPSDMEANQRAVSEGYTLVHGGAMSKGQWDNAKSGGAISSSGSMFPTAVVEMSPDGEPPISEDEWTDGMKRVANYATRLAKLLMDATITVDFHLSLGEFKACYGSRTLSFSKRRCGNKFFDNFPANREEVNSLILHEFGHHYESSHLDANYHRALTRLGAKAIELALSEPKHFSQD